MHISEKAMKNILNYDLYVKIIVNVNNDVEYQICNKSDDMVVCDNIYTIGALENALENWGY